MTRSALPQNYCLSAGTLFEDFETPGDWSFNSGTGVIEADAVNYKTGTQSLKTSADTDAGTILVEKTISSSFSSQSKFATIDAYIPDIATISNLWVRISSTTDYSKYFLKQIQAAYLETGWNRIVIPTDDWTNSGSCSWSNNMIRLAVRVQSASGKKASVSWDNLSFGQVSSPKVLFTFDDAYQNAYDNAYSYMDEKGLRGTFFPCSALIGTSGKMAAATLDVAYANGWAVANHTSAITALTTLTEAQIISDVQAEIDYLLGRGYARSAYHLALPDGTSNDLVLSTLANLGIKTIRSSTILYNQTPFYYPLQANSLTSSLSLAAAKGYVDNAVKYGATLIFYGHQIDTVAGSGIWATADFQALIDYALTKRIDVVTVDEWYNGLTNPRYRSIPLSRATV